MSAASTAAVRVPDADPVEDAAAAPSTGTAAGRAADEHEQDLRAQVEQALRERDAHLNTLQRVQAEYDNYRRRAQREHAEQRDRGGQELAERLLPVLDAFDGALPHAPEALAPLHRALVGALADAGLERLEPTGAPFDPAEQHAVEQLLDDEQAAPVVDQVLRPGYRWRSRLVRPAMVRVRG